MKCVPWSPQEVNWWHPIRCLLTGKVWIEEKQRSLRPCQVWQASSLLHWRYFNSLTRSKEHQSIPTSPWHTVAYLSQKTKDVSLIETCPFQNRLAKQNLNDILFQSLTQESTNSQWISIIERREMQTDILNIMLVSWNVSQLSLQVIMVLKVDISAFWIP